MTSGLVWRKPFLNMDVAFSARWRRKVNPDRLLLVGS